MATRGQISYHAFIRAAKAQHAVSHGAAIALYRNLKEQWGRQPIGKDVSKSSRSAVARAVKDLVRLAPGRKADAWKVERGIHERTGKGPRGGRGSTGSSGGMGGGSSGDYFDDFDVDYPHDHEVTASYEED